MVKEGTTNQPGNQLIPIIPMDMEIIITHKLIMDHQLKLMKGKFPITMTESCITIAALSTLIIDKKCPGIVK